MAVNTPPTGFQFESPQLFNDPTFGTTSVLSNLGQPDRAWSGLENVALEPIQSSTDTGGGGTGGGTGGGDGSNPGSSFTGFGLAPGTDNLLNMLGSGAFTPGGGTTGGATTPGGGTTGGATAEDFQDLAEILGGVGTGIGTQGQTTTQTGQDPFSGPQSPMSEPQGEESGPSPPASPTSPPAGGQPVADTTGFTIGQGPPVGANPLADAAQDPMGALAAAVAVGLANPTGMPSAQQLTDQLAQMGIVLTDQEIAAITNPIDLTNLSQPFGAPTLGPQNVTTFGQLGQELGNLGNQIGTAITTNAQLASLSQTIANALGLNPQDPQLAMALAAWAEAMGFPTNTALTNITDTPEPTAPPTDAMNEAAAQATADAITGAMSATTTTDPAFGEGMSSAAPSPADTGVGDPSED